MAEQGERVYGEKSPMYSSIERINGSIEQNGISLPFDGTLTIRTSYKNRMPISSHPIIKFCDPSADRIKEKFVSENGVAFDCDIIINKHGRCGAQLICSDTIHILVNTPITKE